MFTTSSLAFVLTLLSRPTRWPLRPATRGAMLCVSTGRTPVGSSVIRVIWVPPALLDAFDLARDEIARSHGVHPGRDDGRQPAIAATGDDNQDVLGYAGHVHVVLAVHCSDVAHAAAARRRGAARLL